MKSRNLVLSVALALASASSFADTMVGGAQMYANKNIIDNAMNSQDHTTLVTAVAATDLVPVLQGAGPFTVFAPTNDAFARLPAGTVDMLLKPESKAKLSELLTYHVVSGRLDSAALRSRIAAGNGRASLRTVEGETLYVASSGDRFVLTDAQGGTANVTIPDVQQSNGVIQVVDRVLMPAGPKRVSAVSYGPWRMAASDPNNFGGG